MKKKWIHILFLLILLSACDQSFIDRPQLAVQTADNFYKTENDAVEAVTAVYNYFQSYDFEVEKFEFGDIASDDAEKGGESDNDRPFVKDLEYFRARSDNYSCSAMWKICYTAIFQANNAITHLPDITMNEALKERLLGEVRFMRAPVIIFT